MRKFICSPFGEEVDLDDPKTYKHLPQNIKELREKMFANIGYSHCYMNFWKKEIFGNVEFDGGQKQRVELLIQNFTDNEHNNYDNVLWYQEQIFLFEDEIENMC